MGDCVFQKEKLLQHYQPNEEWSLKNLSVIVERFAHEDSVASEIRLVLTIQRKPLYIITGLLFPTYIICALSVAGLYSTFSTRDERQAKTTTK